MSGSPENEDLREAPNLSLKTKMWFAAGAWILYAFVSMFLDNDRTFIALCSMFVLAIVEYADWHLRRKIWFWILMAFWAIAHALAIALINWDIGVAAPFTPIFILDLLVVAYSTTLIERFACRE